jgi:hypothetical protein
LPPTPFSEDFAFLFALAVTVAVVAIKSGSPVPSAVQATHFSTASPTIAQQCSQV